MTVHQMDEVRRPRLAARIAAGRAAVEAAGKVGSGELDRFELAEAIAELAALESQVTALKLSMLAEAESRRVAEDTADSGTDAWAARLTGSIRAVMAGGIWLARLLRERYDATREAFAAGQLDVEQVRVIVRAGQRVPEQVTKAKQMAGSRNPQSVP